MLRRAQFAWIAITWLSLAVTMGVAADMVEDLAFEDCASSDCADVSSMAESDDAHLPSARLDPTTAPLRLSAGLPLLGHLTHDTASLAVSDVPVMLRSAQWASTLNPRSPSRSLVALRI